ncbi:hypothetical protein HDU76_007872, partial [Blyttiomyces sp. JEL0837]
MATTSRAATPGVRAKKEPIKVIARCRPASLDECDDILIEYNKIVRNPITPIEPEELKEEIAARVSTSAPFRPNVNSSKQNQREAQLASLAKEVVMGRCTYDGIVSMAGDIGNSGKPERKFEVDKAMGPLCSQEDVYDAAVVESKLVEGVLAGLSSTVFAYGGTGSGKSFTIMGDLDDLDEYAHDGLNGFDEEVPSTAGITPRVCLNLFEGIKQKQAGCKIQLSYLEIYNEDLYDLLLPDTTSEEPELKINSNGTVKNLTKKDFSNPCTLIQTIIECAERRQTEKTAMNERSSRSHTICQLVIKEPVQDGYLKRGRFTIVDLA